jgi:tetratricopeptide (TPR) repeat protein
MSRLRRLLFRVALAVTAPLAVITVLELTCHLAGWGHPTRFLLRAEHEGVPVWIDNQIFGYRFFDPAVSRAPTPILVPVDKASNEFRIVVLGESAAMGEPEPAYGPSRMLEHGLAVQHPDKHVRVINAAMTAINSHVIVEIARDLGRLQPDVVILYIGNNEVVGPFGPGTVFHAYAASPSLNRLRAVLTRLRITSAVRALLFSVRGDREIWRGMEMFTRNRVSADDPRLEIVYESMRGNIGTIIRKAEAVGARVIINTIAVNLADQAPLDGSPQSGDTSLGMLKQLRNADTLRFRADSRINQILHDVASAHHQVRLVDAEQEFERDGIPGNAWFIDHVHFTFDGSYRLARLWSEAVHAIHPSEMTTSLTRDEMAQRLIWNPYNALEIAEVMLERASRPPFFTTADRSSRLLHWTREHARLMQQTRNLSLDEVMHAYDIAMKRDQRDVYHPQQAIRALLMEDRFQDAGERLAHLHAMIPHRADVRGWMTIWAALAGKPERAWDIMTRDAPDLGQIPADMIISASETLLQAGYREESLALLSSVAAHYPNRLRLQALLASRYAQTGQTAQALEKMERLAGDHPDERWIQEEFGLLLAMSGRPEEAITRLTHLAKSFDPHERMKWIQFLLYQRRVDEAEMALLTLIDEAPDNGNALQQAARINRQRGDLHRAILYMEQWLEVEPWHGAAWGLLGDWYDEADRTKEAVEAYAQAIILLPQPVDTQRALAWLLATDVRVIDPPRALEMINDVLRDEHPSTGYSLLVKAAALSAAGRPQEAVDEIDRALRNHDLEGDPALAEQLQQAKQLFTQGGSIRR